MLDLRTFVILFVVVAFLGVLGCEMIADVVPARREILHWTRRARKTAFHAASEFALRPAARPARIEFE